MCFQLALIKFFLILYISIFEQDLHLLVIHSCALVFAEVYLRPQNCQSCIDCSQLCKDVDDVNFFFESFAGLIKDTLHTRFLKANGFRLTFEAFTVQNLPAVVQSAHVNPTVKRPNWLPVFELYLGAFPHRLLILHLEHK